MKPSDQRKRLQLRWLLLLTVAVCPVTNAGPAWALPAPMSAEELEKKSDVIASVRVLAVACTGHVEDERTKERLPTYQAWLQVVSVKKGPIKEAETLLVEWRDTPKKLIGAWKVEYYPGEEVTTHLKWDADHKCYHSTWWNGKSKPAKPADSKTLPEKPGQVIGAKKVIPAANRVTSAEQALGIVRKLDPDRAGRPTEATLHDAVRVSVFIQGKREPRKGEQLTKGGPGKTEERVYRNVWVVKWTNPPLAQSHGGWVLIDAETGNEIRDFSWITSIDHDAKESTTTQPEPKKD